MQQRHNNKLSTQQSGLVSIVITMFLMIVITLIVLGFAKITRREQRQVLDKQLSTQAFYAAESGINDAVKAMNAPGFDFSKNYTNCNDPALVAAGANQLDAANTVSYSCLLVNPSPKSLVYDSVDIAQSTVVPINATSAINTLSISWNDTDSGSNFNCRTAGQFPAGTAAEPWQKDNTGQCDAGILRIDVVPTSGAALSRSGLTSGAFTAFLYPQAGISGGTTYAFVSSVGNNAGQVVPVKCNVSNTPRYCTLNLTMSGGQNYYARLRSVYKDNSVVITANNGTLALSGAQAMVDSTGKATDVLRRISVRVDISSAGSGVPSFAIQSRDAICKRFGTAPGFAPIDDSAAYNGGQNCSL